MFVLPLFLFTPDQPNRAPVKNAVRASLGRLASTMKDLLRHHRTVALFLLARMLYADGLGAVFAFGGIYAASVFGWGATELGLFGILLTVAGTVGAASGGLLDDRLGSKAGSGGALRVVTCPYALRVEVAGAQRVRVEELVDAVERRHGP